MHDIRATAPCKTKPYFIHFSYNSYINPTQQKQTFSFQYQAAEYWKSFLPFAVKVRIWEFLYRPVAEPGDKKAVQKHRPTIRQRERKGTLSFLSLGLRRIQENVIYSTHLNRFQNPTWFPGWQLTYSVQFVYQLFARAQAPWS